MSRVELFGSFHAAGRGLDGGQLEARSFVYEDGSPLQAHLMT